MAQEEEYYSIGKITRPHGLKGEVTVVIHSDAPELSTTEVVFIKTTDHFVPYFIESVSMKGKKAYVKFEGVGDLKDAEAIAQLNLHLPKAVRPKPKGSDFYDDEIIGFAVQDESFGTLGSIREVIYSGSQRLLSIQFREKELLIPVNGPFIKKIDNQNKTMTVLLPDGYLDL